MDCLIDVSLMLASCGCGAFVATSNPFRPWTIAVGVVGVLSLALLLARTAMLP